MSSRSAKEGPKEFHSTDNKSMLWTALQDSGAFIGLGSGTERQVVASIESRMVEAVSNSTGLQLNVTGLNKQVLKAVMADIDVLKRRPEGPAGGVQRAFARKEGEIRQMAEGTRPRPIDFSDPVDEPMTGSMDRAVEEALARRSSQMETSINQYATTMKQAEGWVGRKIEGGSTVRQLKIGKTLHPDAAEAVAIPPEKKVRFEAPQPLSTSGTVTGVDATTQPPVDNAASRFLNSIKKTPSEDNRILEALERIEAIVRPVPDLLRQLVSAASERRSGSPAPPLQPPSPVPASGIEAIGEAWEPPESD